MTKPIPSNLPATLSELAVNFPALNPEVSEGIREALEGESIGARDLPRIVLPSGGSTSFEIPMAGGEMEPVKSLDGIVLAYQVGRRYYATKETTNTPPNCASVDGIYGVGKPGGNCSTCPLSQWESDAEGKGQACKQRASMALLMPGMGLAYVVDLPPTSLKVMGAYKVQVLAQTLGPLYGVVTSFSLEKRSNASGQAYAVLVPRIASRIDAGAKSALKAMAEVYKSVLISDHGRTA